MEEELELPKKFLLGISLPSPLPGHNGGTPTRPILLGYNLSWLLPGRTDGKGLSEKEISGDHPLLRTRGQERERGELGDQLTEMGLWR